MDVRLTNLFIASVYTVASGTSTKAAPAPPGGDVNDVVSEVMMSHNVNQNYATRHLRCPVIIAPGNTWSPNATTYGKTHQGRPTRNKSPSQSAVPTAAA
jgi:hypothetical protein